MLERYQGKDGRATLLNALRSQFIIDGHSEIADKIASAATIREYAPEAPIFTQGERGSDLSFILAGRVSVRVNDRQIATCGAGMHIGEIGMLEPFKGRSATVVAIDTVIIAQVDGTAIHGSSQVPSRPVAPHGAGTWAPAGEIASAALPAGRRRAAGRCLDRTADSRDAPSRCVSGAFSPARQDVSAWSKPAPNRRRSALA